MFILHMCSSATYEFYVASCVTSYILYLYNTYGGSNLNFLSTYLMCILCESIVMQQSISIIVHDHHVLCCLILHEYKMEQFFIFQQWTIVGIMCITCITCKVYHFDYISHNVVKLKRFILKTLLTYLNTYVCITA